MKTFEATEQAYKNGYEQGKKDALKPIENDKVMERLTELLRNGILAAMDDEDRYLYTDVVDYMMARGVTIATDNMDNMCVMAFMSRDTRRKSRTQNTQNMILLANTAMKTMSIICGKAGMKSLRIGMITILS